MSGDLITTVAFSEDGRYLTGRTEKDAIRTWRVDVRSLVEKSADGPARVWPVSDWKLTIAAIERKTTACLTAAQRTQFLAESDRTAATEARRCRPEPAK
jgi:hypothetical protein